MTKPSLAFTTDTHCAQALRSLLLHEFGHLKKWRKTALQAKDPEGVHQVRVSLRRMRTALEIFQPILADDSGRVLNKMLKQGAKALDNARDLDVLLTSHFTDCPGTSPLHHALLKERKRAYKQMRKTLKGRRYKQMRHEIRKLAKKSGKTDACRSTAVKNFADVTLRALNDQITAQSVQLDIIDDRALHRLRINCKKLRYTSEFFGSLYPGSSLGPFIEQLKQLQDVLGDIHDCFVQQHYLGSMSGRHGREVATLLPALAMHSQQRKKELSERLTSFCAAVPPWAGERSAGAGSA